MRKYTFLLLFILVSYSVSAQKYRTAVGARLGKSDFGFSVQQKVTEKSTLEGILSTGDREITGTVLLEKHFPIIGKGLNWYVGGGAHGGNLKDHGAFYGVDAILGTEMKLPLLPLLLSLDIKPAVHFNHVDWGKVGGGLTLRYILVKEKKEKRNLMDIFDGKNNDRNKNDRNKNDSRNKKKNNSKNEPRRGGLFGL